MTGKTTIKKADAQLPAFLNKDAPIRGSENVGADDIVIPRILLLQQLSPQLDKSDAQYIEGASAGDIVNSLTNVCYGDSITIVPIYFRKEYVVWKDRTKGGGYCGSFKTLNEAKQAIAELDPPMSDYNADDTATQFVFIVNADGSLDQAMLTMSKTKLSFSRKLQSLIRMTELDSFATQYKVSSVQATSDLGKYYNFAAVPAGFVAEEVYHAGEACYEAIVANEDRYVPHSEKETTTVEVSKENF